MVINNFIRLFIHYNLILKILFNIKCILETYMKPHLQFTTHVKQTSNHNTRCSPVMDVTIRDKIKQKIFSKDWVASSKLASIYIQDPNRTWDQYLHNILYLQHEFVKQNKTFEPCYVDIGNVWKYKQPEYKHPRPEENSNENKEDTIEINLGIAKKNRIKLEQQSYILLQQLRIKI